jgi:hypothetical protein
MRPPLCALGGSARPGTLHPAFTLASAWVARWGMTPIRLGAAGRDLGQHFFAGTGMPRASGRRGERSRWPSLPLGAQDLRLAFSLGAQGRALLLALPVRIWGCLPPGRRGSCRACRGRGASASPPPPGLEREPVDADAPPAGGPVEHAAHSALIPSREVSVCSSDIPPIRFRSVVHGQPLDPWMSPAISSSSTGHPHRHAHEPDLCWCYALWAGPTEASVSRSCPYRFGIVGRPYLATRVCLPRFA